MSERFTIRAYARHRGCNESSVRKAITAGRITKGPDGKIDPAKADAEWAANTGAKRGSRGRATDQEDKELLPVSNVAIHQVRGLLGKNGDSSGVTLLEARVAKTIADAHQSHLKAQRMEGKLTDREMAERFVFGWYRQLRDAWLAWPARISAVLAAEINGEYSVVHAALERHVHDLLSELADAEPTGIE